MAAQSGQVQGLDQRGLISTLGRSSTQSPWRRLNLTGPWAARALGTTNADLLQVGVQKKQASVIDLTRGGSLTDRAALERMKHSGKLSAIGCALVAQPRFQNPGQCHINALQNVHLHACGDVVSHPLEFIRRLGQEGRTRAGAQSSVLGSMAALLQLLMHLNVSVTGRAPHGFENAESQKLIDTPEAMAALIRDRSVLVVQGSGRAVTAPDSELRKPLPPAHAIEIGQPVTRESDGSVNSSHSIVVLAVATGSDPVPGLAPGQCLVFDQDPHRVCIREALCQGGLSQTRPDELTPDQIKDAGVDHLMTRVVSFHDLCQTLGTGGSGVVPVGGLIGGRFFVPLAVSP